MMLKRAISLRKLLCLLVFVLVGCGSETADSPESAIIERGQTVYVANCASCHGENLEGQPDWKERNPDGTWRSPPHDDSGHTWHHDDAYILDRIINGTASLEPTMQAKSNMPAYGDQLTDAEIEAVLAFIKSKWSAETRQMQSERNNQ